MTGCIASRLPVSAWDVCVLLHSHIHEDNTDCMLEYSETDHFDLSGIPIKCFV